MRDELVHQAADNGQNRPGQFFSAQQFVANFATIADAPGAIERLRAFVLGLAFAGRLSRREPKDGTGSDLVARLRTASTLAGGRRRNQEGNGSELMPIISALPEHWDKVRLGEIALLLVDGSHNPPKDVGPGGIPMLSGQNVRDGAITLEASRYVSAKDYEAERIRTPANPGDVLLSIVGSIGRSAVIPEGFPKCAFQRSAAIIRTGLVPHYLSYFLRSPAAKAYYAEHGKGTAQLGIYLGRLRSLHVPVPPLAEQKRIIAKVDELMRLLDDLGARQATKRETQAGLRSAALDALTSAEGPEEVAAAWTRVAENFEVLFERSESVGDLEGAAYSLALKGMLREGVEAPDALSELRRRKPGVIAVEHFPYRVPNHWTWLRLDDLTGSITDGDHQPPPKATSGVPFLTIGNVTSGHLDFTGTRFVPRTYFDSLDHRRVPAKGDILYTVVGATYGRPVSVDDHREFCVQRHIAILRPDGSCDRDYLLLFLRSPLAYKQATASITGTAQPTVALKPLRRFVVPVPPVAEQRRIVAKVGHLMKMCDDLKAQLRQAGETAGELVEAVVGEMVAA